MVDDSKTSGVTPLLSADSNKMASGMAQENRDRFLLNIEKLKKDVCIESIQPSCHKFSRATQSSVTAAERSQRCRWAIT